MPQGCFLWWQGFCAGLLQWRLVLHTGKSFSKSSKSSCVSLQSFNISNYNSLIAFVLPQLRLITPCYLCDVVQPSPSSSSSTSRRTCHLTETTHRPSPKQNPALKRFLLQKKQCVFMGSILGLLDMLAKCHPDNSNISLYCSRFCIAASIKLVCSA